MSPFWDAFFLGAACAAFLWALVDLWLERRRAAAAARLPRAPVGLFYRVEITRADGDAIPSYDEVWLRFLGQRATRPAELDDPERQRVAP